MPLSDADKTYITLFKAACTAFDETSITVHYNILMSKEYLREELDFQVIPDALIALSAGMAPNRTHLAEKILFPNHVHQQPYSLRFSTPQGLLLKTANNLEALQRILEWPPTRSLFNETHRGLQKYFLDAINNADEAAVQLLLQHFPTLATAKVNDCNSPLMIATSAKTISYPIIHALLQAGANPNGDFDSRETHLQFREFSDKAKHRPIHQAIISGHVEAFELLFHTSGIDLKRPDGFEFQPETANHLGESRKRNYTLRTAEPLTPLALAALLQQNRMLALFKTSGIMLSSNGSASPEQPGSRKRARNRHHYFGPENQQQEEQLTTQQQSDATSEDTSSVAPSSITKMR